jgi:hypothetical protein
MRPPRALSPSQARGSLAERVGGIADMVRDRVSVRLGFRVYRVFLTWTRSGLSPRSERGDGRERLVARAELLPVPRVQDLSGLLRRSWSTGTVSEGSVRVDGVSVLRYTEDELRGLKVPDGCECELAEGESLRRNTDFFYEVVEDGRGDDPALRRRFRLMTAPFRDAERATWVLALEKSDRDSKRDGTPEGGSFPSLP